MATYSTKLSLKIRGVQDHLSEQLQVTESLTDYLYHERVFEESEIMRIRFAETPSDKARQMVRILQTRSDEDISKFIVKLKQPESQPWLADEILNKAIEDTEKEMTTADWNLTRSTKRMEDWTVDEVCSWLKSIQQEDDVIETFKSEKISGDVLSTVTIADIASFCPAAKFGDRSKIIKNRDLELNNRTENSASGEGKNDDVSDDYVWERFQNFGRRGGSATPYNQHTCFPKESVTNDDLMQPIHAFFGLQDMDGQEALYQFSVEVVPFICACLNDRINGTCHFGVDKDGMIHGIPADGYQFQQLLSRVIATCFSPDQLEIVRSCVRPVRLVEVKRKSPGPQLYVVEIDIVPVYRLCTDEAFFARTIRRDLRSSERREHEISNVYRFQEGLVIGCSGENLKSFMENKVQVAIKRRVMEERFQEGKHGVQSDVLSDRLTKLLCPGEDYLDGNVYPIFVLSNNSGDENLVGNTWFLQSIEKKTVFDFDDASSPNSVFIRHEEQSGATSNVLNVDYFNSGKNDLYEILDDCSQPWIFCNGFHRSREPVLDASEWKIQRRPAFSKAVQLFRDAIPREQGIVVFLLLSENYDAMLSAAEDLCLRFKWLVISESQQLASNFKEHLIMTLKVVRNEEEFERRSIVGMPWLQVREVFMKLVGYVSVGPTELPTSTASEVSISRKVLNELKDLEVLGSTHLANSVMVLGNDVEKLNERMLDVERRFYQGAEVDWWNFWFQTQVLKRDVQPQIVSCIKRLFAQQLNETSDTVGIVAIYHMPGSGATTLAKHVLWELKDQYRCAVLRTLTKDTPNQLTRLLTYNETCNPKPVLVLLDNYDEFQIQNLKAALELEARNLGKDIDNPPSVPFVLLICMRCSSEAQSTKSDCERRFEIGHSLSPAELQWFRSRYEQMETDWQSKRRFDPRLLISFNIFRENFNLYFVECKATSFVKFVTSYSERLLLKYIAFVGAYDPDLHCIPASCFDQLLNDQGPFRSTWFSRISESLKVLISCSSSTRAGFPMKKIRISHSLLGYYVFREVVSDNETPADVMMEFLNSDMFRFKDIATKHLLKTVTSLLTRRIRQRDGQYKHEFSPLIQSVLEDHSQDRTKLIDIFKRALELEDNHRIAQQLSRFYIFTKDWSSAEEWAVRMTEQYPTKEAVWNTCGLVYKEQLFHRFHDIQRPVTVEEVESSLGLLRRSTEMFQKEQNVGKDLSGLIFEGDTILAFIDIFKRTGIDGFQDTELRRFFIECDYVPSWMTSWKQESIVHVRSLVIRIMHISEELECYYQEIAWPTDPPIQEPRVKKNRELIIKLTEGFRGYFGGEGDSSQAASGLSPEASRHYRRRQIFILKGNTLWKSLELSRHGNLKALEQIKLLAEGNLKTPDRNMTDVQTFIRTTLLIFITSGKRMQNPGHDLFVQLKQMSQELISIRETSHSVQIQIEPYLFFSLLNWPTSTSPTDTETVVLLNTILDEWGKAVNEKNGNQGYAKCTYTGRVLFTIGAGDGLNRIFIDRNIACPVWFRGVVIREGKKLSYSFKEHLIEIQLDRVQHRSRWGTSVFFRIGFTWSGPVAIDVVLEDPGMPCPQVPVVPCQPKIPVVPPQPEIPVVPPQPEIPVVPSQPEIPVVPPQPEIPIVPCQPEIPIVPCQPEIPVNPSQPVAPCQPEIPVVPPQPEIPVAPPVVPCQPVVPCNPVPAAPPHHGCARRHHGHGHGHGHGHCHKKPHGHHGHKKRHC